MAKDKLTPKERAFTREFVKTKNGKKSAIAAGYTKRSAEVTASKKLRIPKVKAEIERLEAKRERKDLLKADDVERELDRIIKFNLKDFVNKSGEAKPLHELKPEQTSCIKEFSTIETQIGTSRNMKFYDKLNAIRTKMQRLGMLTEKVEHSGVVEVVETVNYSDD